jgi:hypothetical protein
VISLILIFLAGVCNAVMDVLRFRFSSSVFRFCDNQKWVNPLYSHRNKWKDGNIDNGEAFLGSSTIFVFVTDFWHFSKFLMLLFMMGSVVFYVPLINWWVDLILIYSIFTIIFELFYSRILIRKN